MLLRMVTVARVKLKKKRKQSRKRGQQAQRLAVKNGVQPGVVADALEGSMAAQEVDPVGWALMRVRVELLSGSGVCGVGNREELGYPSLDVVPCPPFGRLTGVHTLRGTPCFVPLD